MSDELQDCPLCGSSHSLTGKEIRVFHGLLAAVREARARIVEAIAEEMTITYHTDDLYAVIAQIDKALAPFDESLKIGA